MEPTPVRRWLAGLVDLAIPLACYALAWPVAIVLVVVGSIVLGLHAAVLLPVPLVLGLLVGVVVNELAFPQARGWSIGMLVTRLRISSPPVRGGRLLLRSVVTWASIIVVYVGGELVRWELIATGSRPHVSGLLLGLPTPFAAGVTFGWALLLTFPFQGRSVLDRVAGWQVTDRSAVAPDPAPRERAGRSLWAWALVSLAGAVVAVVLIVVAVIVVVIVQNPGPVAQVESDLRHAATALEVYHRNHGRYAEEAVESSYWGYHRDVDVWLEVYISPDGQSFCLEGFHADSAGRISTYDSSDGLDRERAC